MSDTSIVAQGKFDSSARLLTVVEGAAAPTAFPFAIDSVSTAVDLQLRLGNDGAVAILDNGEKIAQVATPWAYDANGLAVPTWFTVTDGDLVLNVDHREVSAYPVVADPSWWWWGRNVGACLGVVALSAAGSSAKLGKAAIQMARFIKNSATLSRYAARLGGVTNAIKKILGLLAAANGKVAGVPGKFRIIKTVGTEAWYAKRIGATITKVLQVVFGAGCMNILRCALGWVR